MTKKLEEATQKSMSSSANNGPENDDNESKMIWSMIGLIILVFLLLII